MKRLLIMLCIGALLLPCCAPSGGSGPAAEGLPYRDALDREVVLPHAPQRTAALLGSFADVWLLAGGSLCAAAEDAFEDFGLEPGSAANIGGAHSPSLELLLAARPQLVLASASTAAHVDMRETLEAAGIPVVYFDVDNFTDYLHMLDICTLLTGRRDLYRQNGVELQHSIETVKAEYAALQLPDPQRTVLLLRAASSFVKAKGSTGTVLGEMLADMGCINIADSETSLLEDLSVEAVLQAQPYRIFVVTMGSDTQAAHASLESLLAENPAWSSLEAVREGRLHIMEKELFNLKPNARWAEAYGKLYDALTQP